MAQGPTVPTAYKIRDEGSLHKYRTEIPNTIVKGLKGRGLSLPARWLYVYLKSVAGEGGECWQNTTTLAAGAQIARGTVTSAKQELITHGLIGISTKQGKYHDTDKIRIIDIWDENMREFSSFRCSLDEQPPATPSPHSDKSKADDCSPPEQPASIEVAGCSPDERGCSPDERHLKKNPLKKNPSEEEENLLATLVSYPGAVHDTHNSGEGGEATPVVPTAARTKKPRKPPPISAQEWPGLRELLTAFDFPLAQLDDNDWWNDLSYACNDPTNAWLECEFAKIHAWLLENPRKQPTTRWKTFLRGWLQRAYEQERKRHASQKKYTRP